jgi:hypothetical protein
MTEHGRFLKWYGDNRVLLGDDEHGAPVYLRTDEAWPIWEASGANLREENERLLDIIRRAKERLPHYEDLAEEVLKEATG